MTNKNGKRPPLVAERRYPQKSSASKPKAAPKAAKSAAATTTKRKKAAKPRRRHSNPIIAFISGTIGMIFRVIWGFSWRVGLLAVLIIGGWSAYYATQLPPASDLVDARTRGSVTMLDRDGHTFAWRGEQFGGLITPETASPYLVDAVVATEDKRFYRHFGISPRGIASAIRINMREGRGPLSGHGGSTITQQVAKLLCLGVPYDPAVWETEREYEDDCRRTTLWRKAKEAVYSVALELRYSKEEILTIYLNRAYLGAGARGFEAASQRYFGKSASDVTPSEAAMLAGLLKAPSTYAPTANLSRAQDRANLILGLMHDQGYISLAEAESARQSPAELSRAAAAKAGGYFADWVMESGPEFFTRDTTEDVIIETTLDQGMQRSAEQALQAVFEAKLREGSDVQAAIVVMSADGAVRAMVGGRETQVSGAFNRATQALRQTGSSFKPFVYAAALDLGYSPLDFVVDEPWCMDIPGSSDYCPKNYDRTFKGRITLLQALMESRNVPAVKVSEFVGRDVVTRIAQDFGVASEIANVPSMALGASESTLIEMTGAYAGILNGGSSVRPYGLKALRFQGDSEPVMGQGGGMGERVITENAAQQLTYMMYNVVQGGTGARARLSDRQVAGKTGTTDSARDAWFIGFTAEYVVGIWMGYDNNTPMTGVTGGGLPAEIFHEVMLRINEDVPARPLPMQEPTQDVYSQQQPYNPVPQNAPPPGSVPFPEEQVPAQNRSSEDVVEDIAEEVLIQLLNDALRN